MGEVTPQGAMGPTRTPDGQTILGRLTTTDEQRMEVIAKMTEHMTKNSNRGREVRAKVLWTNAEPTVLEVTFSKEHIESRPVYLPSRIVEYNLNGAEIKPDEEARLRILNGELASLHERGML